MEPPSPLSALPAAAGGLPTPSATTTASVPTTPTPPLAKDPSYKAIKSRYYQSLNLAGKQRSRASQEGAAVPAPPRKPLPTATSAPIAATHTHTRRRSNTQPGVFFAPLPPKEERKPSSSSDNYMQFAMSVPAHMALAQSYAPSYLPQSSLDARIPRDNSYDDLDEEVYGRVRATSFESSQPIMIGGSLNRETGDSPALAVSNFVDRQTEDAEEIQRRRAAKIRSLVSSEAD